MEQKLPNSKSQSKKEAASDAKTSGHGSDLTAEIKPYKKNKHTGKDSSGHDDDDSEINLHRPPGTRTKIIHLIYENKISHSARQKKIWVAKIAALILLVLLGGVFLHRLNQGFWLAFDSTTKSFSFASWWDQMMKPAPAPRRIQQPKSVGEESTPVKIELPAAEKPQKAQKAKTLKVKPAVDKHKIKAESKPSAKKEASKSELEEKAKVTPPPSKKVNRRP